MKNVIVRSLSGIVYIALIVAAIFLGNNFFFALTTIFALLGVYEFWSVTNHDSTGRPSSVIIDCIGAGALVMGAHLQWMPSAAGIIISVYLLVRLTMALGDTKGGALANVAKSVLGVVYVGVPLYMLNLLYSAGAYTHQLVLSMFVMIWVNDTGAFCFGSTLGKRKLCQRLSPKKSWEGFWGGMLCCVAAGAAGYCWFNSMDMALWEWLLIGATVSVFATCGDLFESMVKRSFNVKDSGHLIPGHGGILDRIDSLLFAAPATYIITGLLLTLL